jgi:hypothetical protein
MLTANDQVYHGCKEMTCTNSFKCNKGFFSGEFDFFSNHGVYLHTDCWKYVNLKYGISLLYSHLPVSDGSFYSPLPMIDFGPIQKYWGQDFDFDLLSQDDKMHWALSPLSNNKENNLRIAKIVAQLKLKKEQRQGPSLSATFDPDQTFRMGNNLKIWKKVNGRWVQIKEETIFQKIEILNKKTINKIAQIGEASKNPIFIKSLIRKSPKKIVIEIFGTDSSFKKFFFKDLLK